MRAVGRLLLALVLSVSLAASAYADPARLVVRVAPLEMVTPGRVRVDVLIAGVQPALHPTIEGTIAVGGAVINGARQPVVAAHLPGELDLTGGTFRLGGVRMFHFTPVPPPAENISISVDITVRQGGETATVHRVDMLLLPTLIVPGYLNDLTDTPDPAVLAVLEHRGYRAAGHAPTVFWFAYPSRRLTLEAGARALDAYVGRTLLPAIYAARINVVGYSEGGLLARWNLAYDRDWAHLVDRFVMLGVPNEGTVPAYVNGWYPALASIAATPAAHDMLPTFPFWRAADGAAWSIPPDGHNADLAALNAHPLPDGVRTYAFYGSGAHPGTWAGITGTMPAVQYSYAPGDGIVPAASVLGRPINGGDGIPGFTDRLVRVDLGDVRHLSLLGAAIARIADVLTDRGVTPGSR